MATWKAALHGAFDGTRVEWTAYAERLELLYFTTNDVDTPEQRAVLCSVCHPEMYKLIHILVVPNKHSSPSFA